MATRSARSSRVDVEERIALAKLEAAQGRAVDPMLAAFAIGRYPSHPPKWAVFACVKAYEAALAGSGRQAAMNGLLDAIWDIFFEDHRAYIQTGPERRTNICPPPSMTWRSALARGPAAKPHCKQSGGLGERKPKAFCPFSRPRACSDFWDYLRHRAAGAHCGEISNPHGLLGSR